MLYGHHDRLIEAIKGEQLKTNQQLSELRGMVRSLHQRLDGSLWLRPTRHGCSLRYGRTG
jgi:hypothetical protein